LDAHSATREVPEGTRSVWQSVAALSRRTALLVAVLWLALGGVLAVLTSRVMDWYVMTDELLYERLAISIGQLHSPLPRIHGELIGNVNQLYPLLLAPLFHDTLVPPALHHAHVLNAFLMSSACIPTFLLARRVTQSAPLASFVAALSVCIPWIALSSFLMTEVVAYPAFMWAALAMQNAVASPRVRNDVVLLVALAVAILARTQFAVLLVVVPIALLIVARARIRQLLSVHRVLVAFYAALALTAIGLLAAGRPSSVLGTYSVTAEGNLVPSDMPRSLLEHLAPIGLAMGIVPFIVGIAWLLQAVVAARASEQHAFAVVALVTIAALLFEVTSYDLRFGQGRLHDRYFFYVVPLILIAFAAMLRDARWSRWSLFSAALLLAMAFAFVPVVRYDKFNVDSPVSVLNGRLLELFGSESGAQLVLGFVAIVATLLLLLGARLLRAPQLLAVLLAIAVLAIPAQGAAAFVRLFTVDGTSGRPLTLDQGVVFDRIDRMIGTHAKVTMIPYPFLVGTYWENVAYWWNVEFWNASVQRAVVYESAFTGTPETFPTITLSFDRTSGDANVTPSDYIAQAVAETRFHVAGKTLDEDRGVALVRAERPWRADWLSFDLYRDGWTIPHVDGTIRVFSQPDQTEPLKRYLTVFVQSPSNIPSRGFEVVSNASAWRGKTDPRGTSNQISVCVPPHGYADVHIRGPHFSPIYGDPRSERSFGSYARSGGVLVSGIALADEVTPC
jgi:hypothetical protein